jgi:hypothetical protein
VKLLTNHSGSLGNVACRVDPKANNILLPPVLLQVLVFFTWVVRGVADSVSMWDAVERVTSFCTNIPGRVGVVVGICHALIS